MQSQLQWRWRLQIAAKGTQVLIFLLITHKALLTLQTAYMGKIDSRTFRQ
jgi:hypothetical protein